MGVRTCGAKLISSISAGFVLSEKPPDQRMAALNRGSTASEIEPTFAPRLAFATYDLRTAIGPIDGVASLPLSQGPFSTSLGEVTFDSYSDGASFEARTMAVPEPASVLLFGFGLAVVTRRFRQLRRH